MLPELSKFFDAPMGSVSRVISMFAVGYGVMQLFYGPLGDRWGKYRMVIWATLGCGFGCMLSALSNDLDQLVAARIFTAVFSAAIIPMSLAWVGDVVDYQTRQETLARIGLGTMLGITSGQFFGGFLTDVFGWRWAFVMMSVVFWTVSFLLWRHGRHLDKAYSRVQVSLGFFGQLFQAGKEVWIRTILTIAVLEGAFVLGLLAITATHLHQKFGVSLTLAGASAALFGLGGMLYMATAKFTIRKFGETGLSRIGASVLSLSFLLIAFSPWWPLAMPACFGGGFGFAMFHNTMQAHATQMVPTARGTGVTLFAGFLFLGQSIGVLMLAHLLTYFSSSLVIGSAACVAFALGLYLANATEKRNLSTSLK
jgi:YNFM family putative membrane transporter